jgi:hypothetical protein
MIRPLYRDILALTLVGGAACALGKAVVAAEPAVPLKIVARKTLQGPSQWGVPADFRLIRSFTELVRAIGLDQANAIIEQWDEPKLDFERYMLVYVSAGSQRSSGYGINIIDVARRDADGRPKIVVRWSLCEPKGYVLWVITTPAELVMVEQTGGEPTFERITLAESSTADPKGKPADGSPARPPRTNGNAEGDESSASSAVDWEALVHEYDALGLPRPPAEARPAIRFYDMQLVEERELIVPLHAPRYLLGFVAGDKGERQFYVGTESLGASVDDADLTEFDPKQAPPVAFVAAYDWNAFEIDVAISTAVECHRRDLKSLAEQVLRSRSNRSFEHPNSAFHQPLGLPPIAALRHVAWAHWGNQLTRPGTDRKVIYGRMKELIEREPTLSTPDRRELLQSLSASLEPSQAAVGTPDHLIDQLADDDALYFGRRGAVGTQGPIVELAKRGWEAMPVLLAHLDDRRLTRSIVRPWDGSASYIPQVGELVSNLVQETAGDEGLSWTRTAEGRFLSLDVVGPWWNRVRDSGEEKYAVEHALPVAPGARTPYDPIVTRLTTAYPGRLVDVYRRSLAKHPELNTWALVSAIAAKNTPRVAADILAEGAAHPRLSRQIEALEALSAVDASRFEDLILGCLAKLPPQASGSYSLAEQVAFTRLCRKTDRADVWEALRRATASVDVGLRMEILSEMGRTPKSPYAIWKRSIDRFPRGLSRRPIGSRYGGRSRQIRRLRSRVAAEA